MQEVTITITHNPTTGTTSIQAPGLPPLMALGLMDLAKGMLIAQMTAPQSKLVVPQLSIVGNGHQPQGA